MKSISHPLTFVASRSPRQWPIVLMVAFMFAGASIDCFADQKDDSNEVDSTAEDTSSLNFLIRGRVTDEEGNPIVGATVQTMASLRLDDQITVKSRANGAFAMKVPLLGHYGPSFLVTDAAGELASYVSAYDYTTTERKFFNIKLKPWRMATVTVVDEDQHPVPDAIVILQASYEDLARAQTDVDGKATLKFPADAKVDWINALKDGQGYDYYENYDAFPTQDRLEVPQELTLVLRGSVSVTVTVTDDLNQPVVGANVMPWTIKLPDKLSYANLGGMRLRQTDAQGQAVMDWIPTNLSSPCTMLVHHKDYHCPNTPRYESGGDLKLTASVFRNCMVSGKVTFADGTPAAGIRLQGEGRGETNHYFRGHTTTKADGTYDIKIYPHQKTIIAVTDRVYAAKSATGIDLLPGKKANADFVLTSGTLVRGTLTVGNDKAPLKGETATLIQNDADVSLVRWNRSDADGDYYFRVGPGTYSLSLPGTPKIDIEVKNEGEIVHNGHIARRPRGQLKGTVVDHEGNSVADAEVRGESTGARGHAGFNTRTNSDGQFTTERWMDQMFVYGVSVEHRLAGFTKISDADQEVSLKLVPAAMVHGSAQDELGQPIVGQHVQLSFSEIAGGIAVNFATKTDEDGNFAFPASTGVKCKAYLRVGTTFADSSDVTVEKAQRYELKPIVFAIPAVEAE